MFEANPMVFKLVLALAILGGSVTWAQSTPVADAEPVSGDVPELVSGAATPLPAPEPPGSDRAGATQEDGEPKFPAPAPVQPASATSVVESIEVLTASAADSVSRDLQNVLIEARKNLDAERLPSLEVARAKLLVAIADLESFVSIGTQRGDAWSEFLRLETLKEELAKDKPAVSVLVDLEMNMRQNYLGLEYSQFLAVREGIVDVVRALKYGGDPDRTLQVLDARMEALIEKLNEPVDGADSSRRSAVGLVATYLHESQQVPWAVSQMREKFNVPNVQIYVRESFVNHMLGRPIARPSPVNECILGTRVLGRACLRGGVAVDLLPRTDGVCLVLNMSATMSSNNTGYNRGVVLHSTGTSPVLASKQVLMTPTGISSFPSTVSTSLRTQINSIDHRLRLVRRIARKKAAEQKPQADAIAEGRLRNRIRSQYDEQVDQQLGEANVRITSLQRKPRPEVLRLGIPRPRWAVYSTNDSAAGNVTQAASFQLSASRPSQIERPDDSGIVVQAHQSVAVNTLGVVLGGRTIRSADLDDFAQQFLGRVPEGIQAEADGEAWSISMASFHPIELEFDQNQVTFTLRISKMTRGDQTLADPAIISATYVPSCDQNVLTLTRQGEVSINFARISRGLRAVTLRSFLKAKFDDVFKQEIVTEEIDLTAQMPNAPELEINSIQMADGWLQVGAR